MWCWSKNRTPALSQNLRTEPVLVLQGGAERPEGGPCVWGRGGRGGALLPQWVRRFCSSRSRTRLSSSNRTGSPEMPVLQVWLLHVEKFGSAHGLPGLPVPVRTSGSALRVRTHPGTQNRGVRPLRVRLRALLLFLTPAARRGAPGRRNHQLLCGEWPNRTEPSRTWVLVFRAGK